MGLPDAVATVTIAGLVVVTTVSHPVLPVVFIEKALLDLLYPVIIPNENFLFAFVANRAETASTNAPVAKNNLDFFINKRLMRLKISPTFLKVFGFSLSCFILPELDFRGTTEIKMIGSGIAQFIYFNSLYAILSGRMDRAR
jgi:hypothetical protein